MIESTNYRILWAFVDFREAMKSGSLVTIPNFMADSSDLTTAHYTGKTRGAQAVSPGCGRRIFMQKTYMKKPEPKRCTKKTAKTPPKSRVDRTDGRTAAILLFG